LGVLVMTRDALLLLAMGLLILTAAIAVAMAWRF
jgi:hypothetical protein